MRVQRCKTRRKTKLNTGGRWPRTRVEGDVQEIRRVVARGVAGAHPSSRQVHSLFPTGAQPIIGKRSSSTRGWKFATRSSSVCGRNINATTTSSSPSG